MTESDSTPRRASSLWSRIPMRGVRTGSLGLADQTVISGTNFVFMIVAARELGPAAFGLFGLLYLILGMAESVQDALITTPHTVMSARKQAESYRIYTSSVACIQSLLAFACAGLAVTGSIIAFMMNSAIAPVLLALAFASAASLTQNFTRRVLYTEDRIGAALAQDIIAHGLRLLLLGAVVLSFGLSESRLFVIVGTAFLFSSLVGLWQIRGSLTLAFDRGVFREHWNFGNWLGASKIAFMVPHYVTAALLSATLSVSAYGAYRAALQLVHGANVPLNALDSLLRPRLARDALHGPAAVSRTMRPVILLGGVTLALFAAFLILFRGQLLGLVFGPQYAPYSVVLILLALKPMADLVKDALSNALLAFHLTRAIFYRTLVGALAGIGLGGIAVLAFGLPAAGAITLTGSVASVLWLVWAWKRHSERETERSENQQVAQERLASQ